jgi:hypothetical protein
MNKTTSQQQLSEATQNNTDQSNSSYLTPSNNTTNQTATVKKLANAQCPAFGYAPASSD